MTVVSLSCFQPSHLSVPSHPPSKRICDLHSASKFFEMPHSEKQENGETPTKKKQMEKMFIVD